MSGATQEFSLAAPRPVDVREIEAALSTMWRSVAGSPGADGVATRASALTLLVYTEDKDSVGEVSEMLAEVSGQNPCRAVVMVMDPKGSPAGLTASISAYCHLPAGGGRQFCSEQITLLARGETGPELASVVLPLTVSGLPIYLWWRAGKFEMPPYFDQILRTTQHVIVDSALFSSARANLNALAAWVQKYSSRIRYSDLNWARMTPWREIVAQCFDSPLRRPYLDRIHEVRIEYERQSSRLSVQRAQSLLFTAWLANRLGWEFQRAELRRENSPRVLYFQSRGRPIRVERVLKEVEGGGCGVCFSFEIEADGARFSFSRGPDGKAVQTLAEVPGLPNIGQTVRIEIDSDVDLLNQELMVTGRDRVYEEALALVAKMTA